MDIKKITQKDSQGNTISYEFHVPPKQEIPKHPGEPVGTDTVPAWLTPGEFVMNAEATRMYKPQIEAMNETGKAVQRQQGGSIPSYHAKGGEAGPCWDGYEMVGMKKKSGKNVPNCVPVDYKACGGNVEYKEEGGIIDWFNSLLGGQEVPRPEAVQAASEIPPEIIPSDYNVRPLDLPPESPMVQPQAAVPTPAVPNSYLENMTQAESSGRADAKNPNSSATGLHQFTEQTWLDVANKYEPELAKSMTPDELLELRKDPATSTRMATHLTNENKRILDRKGITPSNDNLYLLHFGGPSSGVKAITAPEDAKAEDIFTPGQLKANPFLKGMTAGEIRAWSKGKVGGNDQASTTDVPQIFSNAVASDKPEGDYFPSNITIGDAVPPVQTPKEITGPYTDDGVRSLSMEEVDAGIPVPETTIEAGPETAVQTALDKYGYPVNAPMVPDIQTDSILDPENKDLEDQVMREERMKQMHGGNSVGTGYQASTLRDKHAEYVKLEEAAGRPALGFKDWADANGMYGLQDKPTEESAADLEFGDIGSEPAAITPEQRAAYVEKQKQKLQDDIAKGGMSEEAITNRQKSIERAEKGVSPNTKDGLVGGERRDDILTDKDLDTAITQDDSNKQSYADQIAEQTKGEETPKGNPEDVAETGNNSSDEEKSAVMDFFREYGLADLYDKQELGRMVAMYLGSRALGYSHAGSLNFSVKNYAKRVDAKADLHRKRVDALLKEGKYTKASIKAFQDSKDIDDLVSTGAPIISLGVVEKRQINIGTQEKPKWVTTKVQKMKNSDTGEILWQTADGQQVPDVSPRVKSYDERLDDTTTAGREYMATASADTSTLYKEVLNTVKADREDFKPKLGPQQAADDFVQWAMDNGIDPLSRQAKALRDVAYRQALEENNSTNLVPYLLRNQIFNETGSSRLWIANEDRDEDEPVRMIGSVEYQNIRNKAAKLAMDALPKGTPQQVGVKAVVTHAMKKFEDLKTSDPAAYEKYVTAGKKDDKMSAFAFFMQEQIEEFNEDKLRKTFNEM